MTESTYSHQNIYSPNNNTSQNIAIYNRLNKNQNNNNNIPSINQQDPYYLYSYDNNANNSFQIADYYRSPNMPMKDNNMYNYNNINNENIDNKNNIINNQINKQINNQINNDKSDTKIKNKNEKENKEVVEDPDEILFQNNDKKKEDIKNEEEEILSSDSDKNSFDEKEYSNNILYGQYSKDKIKRIKNRWKVYLQGCIVNYDNKEIVVGKVNGDLEREW
jgi:hypothetical protein